MLFKGNLRGDPSNAYDRIAARLRVRRGSSFFLLYFKVQSAFLHGLLMRVQPSHVHC